MNRLYGTNDEWATQGYAFARAFEGGAWPREADPSKISRWETARIAVPWRAVRRYEELLGVPARQLTSAVDTINRYAVPSTGPLPLLARPPAGDEALERRIDAVMEAVTANSPVSAADWDDLTAALAAAPGIRLRAGEWTAVAERLLTETIVADGPEWKQRFEAFSRLLGHPSAQRAAVAACAGWAADPTNPAFVETVCLLDTSAHPDAARHVLAQLTAPTNDDAFYGALLACVRKVKHGHFTPEQVREVCAVAVCLLHDTSVRYDDARSLAGSVLALVPPADRSTEARRTLYRLSRAATEASAPPSRAAERWRGEDELTSSAGGQPGSNPGGRPGGHPGAHLVGHLVAASVSSLPREVPRFVDGVLPLLVDEILHAPVSDVRLHAALFLAATPYRGPLAAAMSGETARLHVGRDARVLVRLLQALRSFGGAAERPMVERMVLGAGIPAPVVEAAAGALGHLGGRSTGTFWDAALARHAPPARAGNQAGVRALESVVYSLGISGEAARLKRLADDPRAPHSVRSRADWWLRLPPYVRSGPAGQLAPG
ncbi:hypothetical protein [Streptomyces sp. SID4948]|uniref:hypothetical protein n=1 Tax=Streptomyces sp. SID4948 TaxID=2690287 RepID=UPI000B819B3B|nr:hypothetical protein [Streptomyces sp. SID4948]